jgi:hypothetical protein
MAAHQVPSTNHVHSSHPAETLWSLNSYGYAVCLTVSLKSRFCGGRHNPVAVNHTITPRTTNNFFAYSQPLSSSGLYLNCLNVRKANLRQVICKWMRIGFLGKELYHVACRT